MEWNDESDTLVCDGVRGVMRESIIGPGSQRYLPGKVPLLSRYRLSTIRESLRRERDAQLDL